LLSGYIKDKNELFQVIETGDAKKITNYIDKITKIELAKDEMMNERNELREKILDLILKNVYQVNENTIYINNGQEVVDILKDEFFDIFNYLLNIDNYDEIYKINSSNESHKEIIKEIIEIIKNKKGNEDSLQRVIIPMILTYMLPKLDDNIKTNDFIIENIKISDLYSMAKSENIGVCNTATWKNVKISNEYLFKKLAEMVNRGMYYYSDNKFILELVDNKVSDFKVSIEIDKMVNFLNDNLEECFINGIG